jgi:uncharacterized spore protein YtfJ
MAGDEAAPQEQALREISGRVQEGLARIPGEITVATVFGEPERVGDRVILTAAAVQQAGGFGFGAGGGGGPALEDSGSGAGGGGGGASEGRPVAVIEISADRVTVRPVLDFTRIGLTLLAGLFAVWRLGRQAKRPRRSRR